MSCSRSMTSENETKNEKQHRRNKNGNYRLQKKALRSFFCFFCLAMKNTPAKFRWPTLKNQRVQVRIRNAWVLLLGPSRIRYRSPRWRMYEVILEPGIGQFRELEPRRVRTLTTSLGHFLAHKFTCGKRESVS